MLSVEILRKNGIKVKVYHNRLKKNSTKVIQFKKYLKDIKPECNPKGGFTEVTISLPDGSNSKGTSNCSIKDNYCRKTGVAYALDRAILELLLSEKEAV